MKKVFLALCMLSLTACVSNKEGDKIKSSFSSITENNFTSNGMNYTTFHYTGGGMVVINTTKDSLEVEYYKTQINVNNKINEE